MTDFSLPTVVAAAAQVLLPFPQPRSLDPLRAGQRPANRISQLLNTRPVCLEAWPRADMLEHHPTLLTCCRFSWLEPKVRPDARPALATSLHIRISLPSLPSSRASLQSPARETQERHQPCHP